MFSARIFPRFYLELKAKWYLNIFENVGLFHQTSLFFSLQILDLGLIFHPGSYLRDIWNVMDSLVVSCALISLYFQWVHIQFAHPVWQYRVVRFSPRKSHKAHIPFVLKGDYAPCQNEFLNGLWSLHLRYNPLTALSLFPPLKLRSPESGAGQFKKRMNEKIRFRWSFFHARDPFYVRIFFLLQRLFSGPSIKSNDWSHCRKRLLTLAANAICYCITSHEYFSAKSWSCPQNFFFPREQQRKACLAR